MIPEKCVVLTPAITGWYVDKFFEKFGVENKVLIEYSDFTNLISVVAHSITMENLVIITDHLTPQKMLIDAAYTCGKVGVNFIIFAERPPPSGGGCKAHSLKSMVVKHFP